MLENILIPEEDTLHIQTSAACGPGIIISTAGRFSPSPTNPGGILWVGRIPTPSPNYFFQSKPYQYT